MIKKGQQFECTIDKLGFGGEGVVRLDDLVVFIKGALPGQKVKAVMTKYKKNHAEAKILEVLERSPKEVAAKCNHFGVCGGCKWQSLPYADQLKEKEAQVKECLEHIGKFEMSGEVFEPIVPSPKEYEYRNKVEFSFGYSNMWIDKSDDDNWIYHDEDPTLGFHAPGKWEQVVNIDHCHLVDDSLNQVFTVVKAWCLEQGQDVYNPKTHQGFWRQLSVRQNQDGNILINVVVSKDLGSAFFEPLLEILKNQLPQVQSCFITIHDGLNDDWSKGEIQNVYGQEVIYERLFDLKFSISPQSFFQTNTLGAEELYSVVRDYARNDAETILDLYCGTGTIGQVVAGGNKNAHIVGLELLESAVEDAYKNAKLNGLENVEFVAGPAEKTLPGVLEKYDHFDMVIVDPPRAGMHKKALETLLTIDAQDIVYVSCNPATLARDLQLICEAGYELEKVRAVDMFPHTAHIEVVTKLRKK